MSDTLPFRCRSCGEPLFARALRCPHCGVTDPAGEFDDEAATAEEAAEPVYGFEPLTPRRVVVDVPAAAAQTAEPDARDAVAVPRADAAAAPEAARLWPEEQAAPRPASAADAPRAATSAMSARAPEVRADDSRGDDDNPAADAAARPASRQRPDEETFPEDLAPVSWRSEAAARAQPLPPKPVAEEEPSADAPATTGASPGGADPRQGPETFPHRPDVAPVGSTEPVGSTASGGSAATDAAAARAEAAAAAAAVTAVAATPTTSVAAGEVRPPDAQPTVDRFDEIMAAEDVIHGEIEPPRRPGDARLDISARRDGGSSEIATRPGDLMMAPELGGRELGPPRRRRSARVLAGSFLILLFVALGAAGALFWRQLAPIAEQATEQLAGTPPATTTDGGGAPPPATTGSSGSQGEAPPVQVAQSSSVTRDYALTREWAPLDLGSPPPAGWSISATGPFRIRVDGAVYTVSGPVPFAVPLGTGTVEARAIGDAVTLTISGR